MPTKQSDLYDCINGYWVRRDDAYWCQFLRREGGPHNRALAEIAVRCTEGRTLAVDCGAHIGTWTNYLAEFFKTVLAFEPDKENFMLLERNVQAPNTVLFNVGISDSFKTCRTVPHVGNSGMAYVAEGVGSRLIPLPDFGPIDLLKLDIEGCEWFALKGAEDQIKCYSPVIVLEEKKLKQQYEGAGSPSGLLKEWGYREAASFPTGDKIFVIG